jgi:hypothetical protein
MTPQKAPAMTPTDALAIVQGMTPAELRMLFEDLLGWQVAHRKSVVHLSWYLNVAKYRRDPRPNPEALRQLNGLLNTIGKSVKLEPAHV